MWQEPVLLVFTSNFSSSIANNHALLALYQRKELASRETVPYLVIHYLCRIRERCIYRVIFYHEIRIGTFVHRNVLLKSFCTITHAKGQ